MFKSISFWSPSLLIACNNKHVFIICCKPEFTYLNCYFGVLCEGGYNKESGNITKSLRSKTLKA